MLAVICLQQLVVGVTPVNNGIALGGIVGTLARLGKVPVPRLRVDRGGNSSK